MGKSTSHERILKTASKLFQIQGYHATGLNQIIIESRSPKGSIYHHFPGGKEQIALEAVHFTSEIVQEKLKTLLTSIADPIEAIQSVVQHLADNFGRPEDIEGVPIGLIALETSAISENLRSACSDAFRSWQDLFKKKLLDNGYSISDSTELSIVIQCMLEGALTISVTHNNNEPLIILKAQIPRFLQT